MKRAFLCVALLLVAVFLGCGRKNVDFFDPFRAAYTAEVEGVLYGLPFSATIEMGERGEGGVAPATVILYAPSELSGTTLTRAADGSITVKSGGISVSDMGGVGAVLFALFPTSGSVRKTEVTQEGRTRVALEGAELEFLPDGTPYSVKTGELNVIVVQWQAQG